MIRRITICFFLFLTVPLFVFSNTTKVACVGNSITYGSGIMNREKNSYPAQLQHWLGDKFEVENFGVSATTLLKKGDFPYWARPEFEQVKSFLPDIILIKLGTNDSKPQNWFYAGEFKQDYIEMINIFRNLKSRPRIVIVLPVPVFTEEKWGIRDHIVRDSIIPIVKDVAEQTHSELIDLFTPLLPYGKFFPDQVHPDAIGASILVEEIYKQFFQNFLKSGDNIFNTATHPVPNPEYRGAAAGWGKEKDWYSQHNKINQIGSIKNVNLVFLGNSITQGWGGEERDVWSANKDVWDKRYKPRSAANFGISGDRTQHILWRIENGNFNNIKPKVIVLTIGVNNFPANTATEIADGIRMIVRKLTIKVPEAKILVLGPLPTGKDNNDLYRIKYHKIHEMIKPLDNSRNIICKKIESSFLLSDGLINYELMQKDNIHLTAKGYEKWSDIMEPILLNLLKE